MVRKHSETDEFAQNEEPGFRIAVLADTVGLNTDYKERGYVCTTGNLTYMVSKESMYRYWPRRTLHDKRLEFGDAAPLIVLEATDTPCPCDRCKKNLWKIVEE